MILPDVKIYQALNSNKELNNILLKMRSTTVADENMIFNGSIPEQYQVAKYAPIFRVNYVGSTYRGADDKSAFTRPQILVSYWTKTLAQGAELFPIVVNLLEDAGYYRYSDNHELDPDTADQPNKKMYIFRIYVHGLDI